MRIIYICEPNCTVHKSANALLIKKGGYKLNTIPLLDARCVVVFGNTQITTQVFNELFRRGIDLVFMSSAGLIKGRVLAEKASNVILRIAQFERWKNADERFYLSKRIIEAKINNQKALISKYYRYYGEGFLKESSGFLSEQCKNIENCTSISQLMGIEGISAKKYFECFSYILKDYDFDKRARRPAYDEVNALLNLAYAFLSNEIIVRLYTYSFDIELGFLHGIRYGRNSLSLDLMEAFRPIMIDEFVIYLLNKRIIKKSDFEITRDGCILRTEALKKFCTYYHEYIDNNPDDANNWRKILDEQVKFFRQYILKGGEYRVYLRK